MAKSKLKMTGFARFFIVMLILAPLAYIGASYANGEDGIENIKNLFKGEISFGSEKKQRTEAIPETTKDVNIPAPPTAQTTTDETPLKDEKIENLLNENEALRTKLRQKTKELEEVEAQLKAIKDAINSGN